MTPLVGLAFCLTFLVPSSQGQDTRKQVFPSVKNIEVANSTEEEVELLDHPEDLD